MSKSPGVSGSEGPTRRRVLGLAAVAASAIAAPVDWLAAPTPAAAQTRRAVKRLPASPFGGELQYFRMNRDHVAHRLDLCRDTAYSVIQAYVAWNVHESTEGRFDFTGKTAPVIVNDHADEWQIEMPDQEAKDGGAKSRVVANTDLVGFLTECAARKFAVILRPGPFLSDEWRNGGIPDWLLRKGEPAMFMRGPDGTTLTPGAPFSPPVATVTGGGPLYYFPSPSYHSPLYVDASRRWLRAFAEVIRPFLARNGGPIVAVQVDDESCYYYRFGPFEVDYHPRALARWRALGHGDPPRAWPPHSDGPESLRPALQWQRFKGREMAWFLGTLARDLRRAGVDVPITHELELQLSPPADLGATAAQVLLTPESYLGGAGPETIPTQELLCQSLRAAARNRRNLWATEMDNGDPTLYHLLLGEGISGGLQFTYTAGVEDGTESLLAPFGRMLRTAGPLLGQARRHADVAIVMDHTLCNQPYGTDRWGLDRDGRRVAENHVPALAELLIRAGYAFDVLDAAVARPQDYDDYPTILLASADSLAAAAQHALVRYVRRGGRLICWPAPPSRDELLRPCRVLADAVFRTPVATPLPADEVTAQVAGVRRVPLWRGTDTFRLRRGDRAIAVVDGKPCGYERQVGRGSAVLLGGWLAADSVPGRRGEVFESQQLPDVPDRRSAFFNAIPALARGIFRAAAPAVLAAAQGTLPGGEPQEAIAWAYTNERRGGEVGSGGVLGYFDGERSVGVAELNTTDEMPGVTKFPFHPVLAAHTAAVRRLIRAAPRVRVSHPHVQARLLDGPGGAGGPATVVLINRWPQARTVRVRTTAAGRHIDMHVPLPGYTGTTCPIDWPLPGGWRLVQATATLTSAELRNGKLELGLFAPAGGVAQVRDPRGRQRRLELKRGEHVVTLPSS